MSDDRWAVVKFEPCEGCDGKGHIEVVVPQVGWYDDDCGQCDGTGYWFDVSSAVPVERGEWRFAMGHEYFRPNPHGPIYAPVESSSSGEGGDQWPEAAGDTVRENTEVAPSESVRLVAEAPEGTQPPGLSDGDER